MSNQHLPWSVKGVEPEAREAAKIAARRANLTLGAWLSRCIRVAAAEELSDGRAAESIPPQLPALPMDLLLEAIQAHTDEVVGAIQNSTATSMEPIAAKIDQIAGKIEGLGGVSERLAEAEKKAARAALAVAPLERALSRLTEQPGSGGHRRPAPPPRPGFFRRLLGGTR